MAKTDYTQFKISCSDIYSLFTMPKGVKPKAGEYKKYDRLLNSDKDKSKEDLDFISEMSRKIEVLKDPPLSKTTINSLMKQYGWKIYGKKVAANGSGAASFLKKGTDIEEEAVELLSGIDKTTYKLQTDTIENEYIVGKADIFTGHKIIDTKVSWNVNSFLSSRTSGLSKKYWYQVQGYMELYDVDEAEVVFLLLNTPPELVEREKVKLINRFMIGEIDREKYEIDMDNIESALTYGSISIKKRHFRYKIKREPSIFDAIYKKIDRARLWVKQFEKDMKTNIFVVSSDNYITGSEEDDT